MKNLIASGLLTIAVLICFGFGMDLAEGGVSRNVQPSVVSSASAASP